AHLCESLLVQVPLFQRMMQIDPYFGRHLLERLTFESFPEGEYIFRAGEIAESMYFISNGEVGIILPQATGAPARSKRTSSLRDLSPTDSEEAEEAPVLPSKILGPGSFFGEGALL